MKKIYFNVRGTSDLNVLESLKFREIINKAQDVFKVFCYDEIILPILEEKDLFIKGVGEVTDIVQRQMFKIQDKDIVLRPEGTAQVIRYYIQNSLYKQSGFHKFFYIGPMFRGERPQKGRLRQFYHLGAEAIGSDSFYLDAEIIILSLKILDEIGLRDKKLKINSLGCAEDKIKFSSYIKQSLKSKINNLCKDCTNKLEKNPLRILDCKNEQCRRAAASLELGERHLCGHCRSEFKNLSLLFSDLGIKYFHDPCMVRGIDYYTNTVFEIISSKLGSQDAVGAGGRYNNLVKFLGGSSIPAIGFALGVERILLALDTSTKTKEIDVFVATRDKALFKPSFNIVKSFREAGVSCDCDYCDKSLKGQMRLAQKKGAKFTVIMAQEEYESQSVVLKNMKTSSQENVKIINLIDRIHKVKGRDNNRC